MSQKANIPRSVVDPNYRYKMPLLQQRTEGKGINAHTTLLNLKDVAKALRVPYDYILKFFGYDMSIQINEKGAEMYLNGIIDESDVLAALDRFIDKFILCAKCRLPEMFIALSEKKDHLVGTCYSCGHRNIIDQAHKLTSYILKYPPQNQSEFKKQTENKFVFGAVQTKDPILETKRRDLMLRVYMSPFDPYNAESKAIFDDVEIYMSEGFPMAPDYAFNESHVEVVYKLIKRLRLSKERWDRVGFILFRHIFDEETIKNVTDRPRLFQRVLERHNLGSFVSMEFLLNLQHFYYETHKDSNPSRIMSTRLANLYEKDLIDGDFLRKWGKGEARDQLAAHVLFRGEHDQEMRRDAQKCLEYLGDGEEEEEEEEEEGEGEEEDTES